MKAPETSPPSPPALSAPALAPVSPEAPVRPWTPAHPHIARPAPASLGRADRWNLGLILLGFGALLLSIPVAHDFPVIDDWIYTASVRDMLASGHFTMPEWSQA